MISKSRTNIEIFDRTVLLILTQLHDTFPVPENIEAIEIYKKVATHYKDADLCANIYMNYISSTFFFLRKEKFIEFDSPNDGRPVNAESIYYSAVLTHKGLAILKAVPKSISDQNESNFQIFEKALKDGTTATITEAVKIFFTSALAYISF